jgi:hypothetical protein
VCFGNTKNNEKAKLPQCLNKVCKCFSWRFGFN